MAFMTSSSPSPMAAPSSPDLFSLVNELTLTKFSIDSTPFDSDIRAFRAAKSAKDARINIHATKNNFFTPIDPRTIKLLTAISNLFILCYERAKLKLLHMTNEAEDPEPDAKDAILRKLHSSSSVSENEKLLTAPLDLINLIESLTSRIADDQHLHDDLKLNDSHPAKILSAIFASTLSSTSMQTKDFHNKLQASRLARFSTTRSTWTTYDQLELNTRKSTTSASTN